MPEFFNPPEHSPPGRRTSPATERCSEESSVKTDTVPFPAGAPPAPPKNGLGLASLLIAAVGLATSFTVIGGLVLGTVAAAIGFIGRGRVDRGEATDGWLTVTGAVTGFVAIAAALVFIVVWVAFWANISDSDGAGDYLECLQKAGEDPAGQQRCADEFNERLGEKFGVTITPAP